VNTVRHVIVHYHLFKNGGSTLVAALRRNFGSDFAELEAPAAHLQLPGSELMDIFRARPNLRAVSSHTLRPPLPSAKDIITHEVHILRHPLDRLRSIYDFYRYKGGPHPLVEEARRLDLPSFLKLVVRDWPHLSQNSQLRLLVNVQRAPREEDLQEARRMLARAACIGVVEDYDRTMALMEYYFRQIFPKLDLSCLPRNASNRRLQTMEARLSDLEAQCGSDFYQELLAINELDIELVQTAAVDLKQRSLQILSFESVLRQFRRKQRARALTQHLLHRYDNSCRSIRRRIERLTAFVFGIEATDSSF
jgi:hypothetical protein